MKMKTILLLLFCACFTYYHSLGQQPNYTYKTFVANHDAKEFIDVLPKNQGFTRKYIVSDVTVWDVVDNRYISGYMKALLCFESERKNGKKEGAENVYLIDSANHSTRYKIWEQSYANGKLNGQWKTFTLKGTLFGFQTFKNDSLNGISRQFEADGKTIKSETEYFNGRNKLIERSFFPNGKPSSEIPYLSGRITGTGKRYYENGNIEEEAEFKDGIFDGVRKYYYPNGQLWFEEIVKDGKSWTVVANYSSNGTKRPTGTLQNGNGTVIYYKEDGTVREVKTYLNGIEK